MKKKYIVTLIAVLFLLSILLIAYRQHAAAVKRELRTSDLLWIYMDLYNSVMLRHTDKQCVPAASLMWHPDAKVPASWRAAYASMTVVHANFRYPKVDLRYAEPWNSDHNIKVWNPLFCWKPEPQPGKGKPEDYWTNVMGIVGPDTAFELQTPEKLKGCEHLIFIVSVKDSGVHWGEPRDIDVRHLPPKFREGVDGDGIYVVFLDGAIWFIRKDVPLDLLKCFLTATEARKHNRYDKLIEYSVELHEPVVQSIHK